MKTTQLKKLEKTANAWLRDQNGSKRPESLIRGQRIQSVAVSNGKWFEGTTTNGHAVNVSANEVASWL